jgi:hypothetical protein
MSDMNVNSGSTDQSAYSTAAEEAAIEELNEENSISESNESGSTSATSEGDRDFRTDTMGQDSGDSGGGGNNQGGNSPDAPDLSTSLETTPDHPSIIDLLGAMSNLSEDKMRSALDAMQNENANITEMNDNSLQTADIQLDSAIKAGKEIRDALSKAKKKANQTMAINVAVLSALVVILIIVVVVAVVCPPAGIAMTPIIVGLVCAVISQGIVMGVTMTELLSPTGPIPNPTTRAIVTAVVLLVLIALAVCSGGAAVASMGGASALTAGIVFACVAGGGTAGAIMATNAVANFSTISTIGMSDEKRNEKQEEFQSSKTMEIINYVLLGITIACAIGGMAASMQGSKTAATTGAKAGSSTSSSSSVNAANKMDDVALSTSNNTNNTTKTGSAAAKTSSKSDDIASNTDKAALTADKSKEASFPEKMQKFFNDKFNASSEATSPEIARQTAQLAKIQSFMEVGTSASEAGVAISNYFLEKEIIEHKKEASINEGYMAFYKAAASWFDSAGKEITDSMEKTQAVVTDVNEIFSSLIETVSSNSHRMGRM